MQPKLLEKIVKKCPANHDSELPILHAVVRRDNTLLIFLEVRIGADADFHLVVPFTILAGVDLVILVTCDIKDAGEEEVFVLPVDVSVGTRVPAKAIEADGMRRDPAQYWLWSCHRLVFDVERFLLSDGSQDRL